VSRVLGHSNLSTTADVYAHLTRGMHDARPIAHTQLLGVAVASVRVCRNPGLCRESQGSLSC
jgi:hypothetical protein